MAEFEGTLERAGVTVCPSVRGTIERTDDGRFGGSLTVTFNVGIVRALPDGWRLYRDGCPALRVELTHRANREFDFTAAADVPSDAEPEPAAPQ